ncbi:GIY-YIG nuclease family protein [Zeaxanthinibacter sp. PT1]|uniref:GIY-YIG nuclease family protein n=1 Tax=Zeaxanthinibacter TaxID=561554 RepID=UPI00234AC79D|nr:GIY-YIG nuclease family protein [Zeaxanthinibacter sp. PT1]MDC6352374.1 GIY-YIG nuclease family protein [Zeaxanthinibacter sp. PT1]
MRELPFCVYILKCNNGKFYTGCSRNLNERLKAHQSGEVHFTKDKLPVKLVHISKFNNSLTAYNFERYLKTGSGAAFRNKHLI